MRKNIRTRIKTLEVLDDVLIYIDSKCDIWEEWAKDEDIDLHTEQRYLEMAIICRDVKTMIEKLADSV